MELLPEDCIAQVLSGVSPRDACRSAVVSPAMMAAAGSELLWDKFLPPDYKEILKRSVSPVTFNSKKELFFMLSNPLLIDGGRKTFSIEKSTGKRCYMLSARELYIAWSANHFFWCWKPILHSRFTEAVELITASWLEIQGKINTRILSPKTHYGAYLIFDVSHQRAYGLDKLPTEVSVEVGDFHSRKTIILSPEKHNKRSFERVFSSNNVKETLRPDENVCGSGVFHERKDGWLEIELGEFYNDGACDHEVKMSLREVKGVHLKGGLVVEGIEVRPL